MGTTFRQKLTDNPVTPADGVILPCNDTDNVDGAFTLGTVKTFIGDDTLSRLGDEGTGTIATTTNLITDENKEVTVQDVADTTLSQLGDSGSASSISDSTKFITDENKEVTGRQIADYVNTISNVKAEYIDWIGSITVTVTITKFASGKQLYVLGSRGDIICIELTASKINFVVKVNNAYLTVTKTSDTTFTITGSAGAVTILTLWSNISYTYEITTNE